MILVWLLADVIPATDLAGDAAIWLGLTTVASASGGAGLNIPHGAAPTAPVNGDMWTDTSGAYIRVNGVTKQIQFV